MYNNNVNYHFEQRKHGGRRAFLFRKHMFLYKSEENEYGFLSYFRFNNPIALQFSIFPESDWLTLSLPNIITETGDLALWNMIDKWFH